MAVEQTRNSFRRNEEQPGRPGWWLPGEVNLGLPYKWGGFDDPAAIAAGHAAGDISSPEKRRTENGSVSAKAAGVDCSGSSRAA